MSLGTMVHRFASRCQFGPGISRFQILGVRCCGVVLSVLLVRRSIRDWPGALVAVPGQLCGVCSVVVSTWRVQYHRRCRA